MTSQRSVSVGGSLKTLLFCFSIRPPLNFLSCPAEGKARRAKSARRIKTDGPPPVSAAGNNVALNVVRPSLGTKSFFFPSVCVTRSRLRRRRMHCVIDLNLFSGAIFHPANRAPARSASAGPERRVPKSSSNHSAVSSTTVASSSKGRAAPVVHNNNGNCPGRPWPARFLNLSFIIPRWSRSGQSAAPFRRRRQRERDPSPGSAGQSERWRVEFPAGHGHYHRAAGRPVFPARDANQSAGRADPCQVARNVRRTFA